MSDRRLSATVSGVETEATENRPVETRLEREADGAQAAGADRRVEALVRIGRTGRDRPRGAQVATP